MEYGISLPDSYKFKLEWDEFKLAKKSELLTLAYKIRSEFPRTKIIRVDSTAILLMSIPGQRMAQDIAKHFNCHVVENSVRQVVSPILSM